MSDGEPTVRPERSREAAKSKGNAGLPFDTSAPRWAQDERVLDGLCILALWAGAILFYWPVLFGGQSFYFRDIGAYHYPYARATLDAWRDWRLPHWESRVSTGYPFLADPHSMALYPPLLLMALLPDPRGYDIFLVVHSALPATFLYLLLRKWGLSRPASAVGGATILFFGLAPTFTTHTSIHRGLAWTPAVLLAFEEFLTCPGWRPIAATAFALALEGSCTDPQFVLFTGSLVLVSPWLSPRERTTSAATCLAGAATAGALAIVCLAYQYLPLAQAFSLSDRVRDFSWSEISSWDVDPANLVSFFLPLSFPDPATPFFKASFHGGSLPLYYDLYLGLPAIALAAASLGWLKREEEDSAGLKNAGRAAACGLGVALVALALAFGEHTPFFKALLTVVPPLRTFRFPAKYMMIVAALVPPLIALGFEGLRLGRTLCVKLFGCTLALEAAGTAIAAFAIQATGDRLPRVFLDDWPAKGIDAAPVYDALRHAWTANLGFAVGIAATVAAIFFFSGTGRVSWERAILVLGAIVVLDLAMATCHSYPVADDAMLTAVPVAAGGMERPTPGRPPPRYFLDRNLVYPNTLDWTVFDSYLFKKHAMMILRGLPAGFDSFEEMMSVRIADQAALLRRISEAAPADRDPLFGAAGVRYKVGADSKGTIHVKEIGHNRHVFIARRAQSAKPALCRTNAALFTVAENALFESDDPATSKLLEPKSVRRCDVSRYGNDWLRVEFDLSGSGLLVVLDTWYPGWHAYVDGKERPIHEVAGLFRGVEVAEGERALEMRFVPLPFRIGLAVSVLAWLAIGALALWPDRPPFQKARPTT